MFSCTCTLYFTEFHTPPLQVTHTTLEAITFQNKCRLPRVCLKCVSPLSVKHIIRLISLQCNLTIWIGKIPHPCTSLYLPVSSISFVIISFIPHQTCELRTGAVYATDIAPICPGSSPRPTRAPSRRNSRNSQNSVLQPVSPRRLSQTSLKDLQPGRSPDTVILHNPCTV